MDLEAARRFLEEHHRAVMATRYPDGSLQLTPVLSTIDGRGRAVVSTRETAYKVANLRRDRRVSLCVFTDRFFGSWVQVDGTAEVISLPEAMEPLVDYYRRVAGEHEDWEEYREAMRRERRVLVRIKLERARPDRKG